MNKFFYLLAFSLILLILTNVGCSKKVQNTLYIYNWTYYIPENIIKDFEQKFKVKVVYDVYSSNEEMFAKLKAGGKGYDLVFPSGDFVKIMIKEKMLEAIDKSKVPNFQYMDTQILKKINYDPGCAYSVPYMMGTAGIAVNKKFVKNYEHSSNIFKRRDLQGKMTLLDDMREVMGLALKNLGYSVNTTNKEELEKAKTLILEWKKNILKFDAESFAKGFAAGEFWVVQGYAENIYLELDENQQQDVDYFIPKEGSAMYIDSMVILKDATHIELAYKFINYILEPQVFAQILDYLRLPAINTEARKYVKNQPHYQVNDLMNCEIKEDLGQDVELYNRIWEEIRM
ncbi:MAG: extracellular solute-binding protein [Candidatus Margulisbacteria bacterium]|nr:extracellular solute-binding protein [Candidatus Margulisiibacteriota bacterium]